MPQIGKALNLSDSALESMAQVTELDLQAARSLWASSVPAQWKTLLDAQTVGEPKLSTHYVWDASSRRYIHLRSRRYVPFMEIRTQAIDPMIRAQKLALRSAGAALQDGGSLADWQRSMIEQIKTTQVAASMAANGGPGNMSDKDKQKTAAEIILLLLFLRKFSEELEAKRFPLNGRLLLRSDLYAAAARDTFEETRRFGMSTYFGATQEMRVLGRGEHCTTDGDLTGCIELHDLFWQPIGSLPRLGATPCRSNCLCHFDYRYKDARGAWVIVDDSATVAAILRQFKVRETIEG
jgi:hypothetical protein